MSLLDFWRILRQRWIVVAAFVLVGIGLTVAFGLVRAPQYSATSKLFVSTGSITSVSDLSQGNTFTQEAVKSYADVATSPYVLDPVIKDLGLNTSAASLAERVSATAPLDTTVLELSVTDSSPSRAADIANAVSTGVAKAAVDLTPDTANAQASVKLTAIQRALPPASPASPQWAELIAIGLLGGLAAGVVVALLRSILDTRVRTAADAAAATNLPVLGSILYDGDSVARPLVAVSTATGPKVEAFRSLRTNLQFLDFAGTVKALTFTSSIPGEGKSTTVANLAVVIASTGKRVLLVDADLRRPRVESYMGLDGSVGLTDVLLNTMPLGEAVQSWGTDRLDVLPAGRIPPNPSEMLQSEAMKRLIDAASAEYDLVLFDTPPLLAVADAGVLAKMTDGAVVLAASGRARRDGLRAAVSSLRQLNAEVLGVVVTMLPVRRAGYGYGYGYYEYSAGPKVDQVPRAVAEQVAGVPAT